MQQESVQLGLPERAAALAALQQAMRPCQRCVAVGALATANPIAGGRGPADAWLMLIGQARGASRWSVACPLVAQVASCWIAG
ncbi:MAG: hypothetical protein H0X24_13115 [Ktedonobacterales bacterium]|nr:hypothetical protein [Ktedonobacterales bacterium]